ncbi:MAG: hypothetical protein JXR76_02190 [Deltaproteobacteria bacterium]|nr:hypothetical protein [Deltaproteobacteria bacterium]
MKFFVHAIAILVATIFAFSGCESNESDASAICDELCECGDGCYEECIEVTRDNGKKCETAILSYNECYSDNECDHCSSGAESCDSCEQEKQDMIDICNF